MSGVDDLVAFCRARLDEAEQTALDWQRHKEALTEQFMNDPRRQHVRLRREPVTDAQIAEYAYKARFDPDRMLADIAAKRRILDEHAIEQTRAVGEGLRVVDVDVCRTCSNKHGVPCLTVRLLAEPYADHPDYQEKWKP